jgi:hypothetical protein
VELLARLAVGEVAAPIESLFGIELVVRRPNVERETFAISGLRLRYDPAATPGASSHRAQVEREARALSSELASAPDRLELVAGQRCCQVDVQWQDGRAYGGLTSAVSQLALGQIAREPIEWESSFYITRRVTPAPTAPARVARLDFPADVPPR